MNSISYCIANWKMNQTYSSISIFMNKIRERLIGNPDIVPIICPSFIHIDQVNSYLDDNNFLIGAQNVCEFEPGAFTGEISISMLNDSGVDYVILGHSERRNIFAETNKLINRKLKAIIKGNLQPILCIGEKLEDREKGNTHIILKDQLESAFYNLGDLNELSIIAYEPVWAIGTGIAADIETIENTHQSIRSFLKSYGFQSDSISILYGGSVTPGNCSEIYQLDNVDGFLIGGASLKAETFLNIYHQMSLIRKKFK